MSLIKELSGFFKHANPIIVITISTGQTAVISFLLISFLPQDISQSIIPLQYNIVIAPLEALVVIFVIMFFFPKSLYSKLFLYILLVAMGLLETVYLFVYFGTTVANGILLYAIAIVYAVTGIFYIIFFIDKPIKEIHESLKVLSTGNFQTKLTDIHKNGR